MLNEMKSVVDILDKTSKDPSAVNMNAVAKIMKVMIAQRIDRYLWRCSLF